MISDMGQTAHMTVATAGPLVADLRNGLASRFAGLGTGDQAELQAALADIDKTNIGNLLVAQKLSADVTALGNLLALAAVAPDEDLLRGISVQIAISAPALGKVKTLPDSDFTQAFAAASAALLKFTDPKTGIATVREDELVKEAAADEAVDSSATVSDELAQALGQFAELQSQTSRDAIAGARRQIHLSLVLQWVLAAPLPASCPSRRTPSNERSSTSSPRSGPEEALLAVR